MTDMQQRAALHRQIWQIADEVRGAIDGWDFKQYVLGTLFYRFISENFADYIEAGDEEIVYADMDDSVISPEIIDDAVKTKGYFIYPSQLFCNVAKNANTNDNLNIDLANIFKAIENSAQTYPSAPDIKGLFDDFDITSNRLGNTVKEKNIRLAAVLNGIAELDFNKEYDQYVSGIIFYRFISEKFAQYMHSDDIGTEYSKRDDSSITSKEIENAVNAKGYFIYPSQLFCNIAKKVATDKNLKNDLMNLFKSKEASSATQYLFEAFNPMTLDNSECIASVFRKIAELNFDELYEHDDMNTTSNGLKQALKDKTSFLIEFIKDKVKKTGICDGCSYINIDLFGDAYEFLISNYAASAGKSGGEFFTPQHVSKLIARIALHKQSSVNKIYDPACGSGSLLLQAKKQFDENIIENGFFGQEINHTTYNLARMNMFLHNINYDKFNICLGNTLLEPCFKSDKPFDAIVSNPPYSIKWIGKKDPTLINDERFAPAGVLAPDSKADFAFVLHALNYLSGKGRAAIVCFPGIFYRGGAEQKIRKYLVDNNYVETVIALAPNLFFGTNIAVNILVLSKHKNGNSTQFIDASGLFKKETNNNVLLDEHIDEIMRLFDSKENVEYLAKSVSYNEIVANEYNLSVSTYVEAKDTREKIDIVKLNAEIREIVTNIDRLRREIDEIVAEIEGEGHE